jgi:predicted N-acetyltransferase YhbS
MKTLQELSHEEKIDVLEKEVSPGWRREYLVQLIREEGEQASVALVTQDVHAGVAAGWIPQ